ncbi:hypothetical protein [Mesorhizobium sp. DCY119]|uniref:hypothetical protein n=1 Tax=Mesorhizobium sp. DCY119 TaxID=2108445 RepID=UPI0013C4848B|nr:hypothetical protein [Mesorhizobium sp. DCY119]
MKKPQPEQAAPQKPEPAPASVPPALPQQGGSFVMMPDGTLVSESAAEEAASKEA